MFKILSIRVCDKFELDYLMWSECIYDIIKHNQVHNLSFEIVHAHFTHLELPFLIEKFKVEQVIIRCIGTWHEKQDEFFCELDLIYVVNQGTIGLLLKLLI